MVTCYSFRDRLAKNNLNSLLPPCDNRSELWLWACVTTDQMFLKKSGFHTSCSPYIIVKFSWPKSGDFLTALSLEPVQDYPMSKLSSTLEVSLRGL